MTVTRRGFVLGAAAGLVSLGCTTTSQSRQSQKSHFVLGVASGDPFSFGVVLWTRVAEMPFRVDPSIGVVDVRWRIALDRDMQRVVQVGFSQARPESSHCVHVEVERLEPDTEYFYQFDALNAQSAIGRTHTLPKVGSHVDNYSIAVVSCQDYSAGYFTAYRDIIDKNPDLVFHLGDYIYESAGGETRPYPVDEAMTLEDYRALYAQFRLDPDLRDAHAQFPWMLIWDDHEVVNDWGANHYLPSSHNKKISNAEYLKRKDAAIQAYMEYMPIRRTRRDHQGDARIYDRTVVGNLIELNRLDVRSYRDKPVCELNEHRHFEPCDEVENPGRSLLGEEQEKWLLDGLGTSKTTWNCLVQATVMAPLDLGPGPEVRYEADSWDNYEAARNRIIDAIVERDISNVVSIGGNIHAFYAGIVYDDQDVANRNAILSEIVATSVTANGGGDERYNDIHNRLEQNPGIRYFENRYRGYVWLQIEHHTLKAEFRVVNDVSHPNGKTRTLDTLLVHTGEPRILKLAEDDVR